MFPAKMPPESKPVVVVQMETKKTLEQAVACILADWPALEIAADNNVGGPLGREKARWLVQVTSEFMTTDECGKCKIGSQPKMYLVL